MPRVGILERAAVTLPSIHWPERTKCVACGEPMGAKGTKDAGYWRTDGLAYHYRCDGDPRVNAALLEGGQQQ